MTSLGILGDGHIYNFDSWRNKHKNLVFIGKNEIRQWKTFPIVNWENSFPLFFLFWYQLLFSYFFNQKLFICIHLSIFKHTIQNNTILSSSNITYWKSDIVLVKVQSALCKWNIRPLCLIEFLNICKLYQGAAWINSKTNVSTERWNSRVEFHEKIDQPTRNLDKLAIYFFLNRTLSVFR